MQCHVDLFLNLDSLNMRRHIIRETEETNPDSYIVDYGSSVHQRKLVFVIPHPFAVDAIVRQLHQYNQT